MNYSPFHSHYECGCRLSNHYLKLFRAFCFTIFFTWKFPIKNTIFEYFSYFNRYFTTLWMILRWVNDNLNSICYFNFNFFRIANCLLWRLGKEQFFNALYKFIYTCLIVYKTILNTTMAVGDNFCRYFIWSLNWLYFLNKFLWVVLSMNIDLYT